LCPDVGRTALGTRELIYMKISVWPRVDKTLARFAKQNTVSLYFSILYLIGIIVTLALTCTDLLMRVVGPHVVETRTPIVMCLREYRNYFTWVLLGKSKPARQCIM
jgi:hypothetical protein